MKQLYSIILLSVNYVIFAQVGIATANPNAQLDIRSSSQSSPTTTDGLLIPKMDNFPASNPTALQQGMLVYLTTTVGTKSPGFYYWDYPTLSWIGMTSTQSSAVNPDVTGNNFEDFIFDTYAGAGTNDNQYSFTQSVSGTNAYSVIEGIAPSLYSGGNDYAGRHVLSTGTTSTGKASLASFNQLNRLRLGGKEVFYEIRVRVETSSTASDAFTAFFGLTDLSTSTSASLATANNGVYLSYTHSNNSGKWVGITKSSGSVTNVNSSFTMTPGQWYKIKAIINDVGNRVDFYIDGILVGTSSTNIPTTDLKFVFGIEKSAGTSARTASVDYIYWRMSR